MSETTCAYAAPALCPAHHSAWVAGDHRGRRRCEFYVPELGVSEDYGCPQPAIDAEHLAHQREWSERTFGPGPRTKGVLDHIRKELQEIEDDPSDLREWVDVVILALDGAWRAGWQPQEIINAIKAKQAKNEARTWPDWRTMSADQAIEHDRSQDCACDHDGPHGFCHSHVEALIGGVCECPRPTRASSDNRA